MHGCGNDFIVFDDRTDRFSWHELSALAQRYCRRRFGVGADGLIAVARPVEEGADFEMRYLNADGSRAEMCGNGIRCVGKFIADELSWLGDTARILTGAGVLPLKLIRDSGTVSAVTVEMGVPGLSAGEVPTTLRPASERVVGVVLDIDSERLELTAVSMGNPHAVSFVERISDEHVHELGPQLEAHPVFPQKTNAEFVRVLGTNKLRMRVWERGVGETLACGTGACASVVAAVLNEHVEFGAEVTVQLNGGELKITWPSEDQPVQMTGPAETVYRGELDV
jgi:diaminopimelate epimerase